LYLANGGGNEVDLFIVNTTKETTPVTNDNGFPYVSIAVVSAVVILGASGGILIYRRRRAEAAIE
jgi:hypothetical protein